MDGLLLVGHGSLRAHSAQTMGAVAQVLRIRQPNLRVEPCFLNYGSPTLPEAGTCLLSQGVSRIVVQPYFLTTGQYVLQDLPAQVYRLACKHPADQFHITSVLGDHTLIPDMLRTKVGQCDTELERTPDAFVLMAHGSPYPEANQQVRRVARHVQKQIGNRPVEVAFLDLATPDLMSCCQTLLDAGQRRITVLPFFLHTGRHVMEDLPHLLAQVRDTAPAASQLTLTTPLDDVDVLASIVFDQYIAGRSQDWGTTLQARQNRQPQTIPEATATHVRQSLSGRRRAGPSGFNDSARGAFTADG